MNSFSITPQTAFFVHIPKTAGTSLSIVLKGMYPSERVFHIDNSRYEDSSEEFKLLTAQKKAQLALVDGHMYYGLHRYLPHESSYFTMLRDPVKRLVSLYNYGLQTPSVSWNARMVQEKPTFVEFVKGHYTNTSDNGIARFLSGHNLAAAAHGQCGSDTAIQAISNLKNHFSAIGLLEEFDQSLLLFQHVLAWTKQPLYKRRNVTPKHNNGGLKLIDFSHLTAADLGHIEDYIKWDTVVFRAAKEMHYESIRQIPSLQDKLYKFRKENNSFQCKRSLIGYLRAKRWG
jgi:hypothetical protein